MSNEPNQSQCSTFTGTRPAFPVEVQASGNGDGLLSGRQTGNSSGFEMGLSKRELFAAMAMQGLLASDDYAGREEGIISECSVGYADALIKELERKDGGQ